MMKLGTMLSDVVTSLFKRPATEFYPFERRETTAHLRGQLAWAQESCTGCKLCEMDCPAQALHFDIIDRKAKRFVMTYRVDSCIFCTQCVISCKPGALSMPPDHWELAALEKFPFIIHYGDPADVEYVLAGMPEDGSQQPE
jgi:formate hydrogenlyase subunit 6/NADH:ubiquinone oxidoreductase subunit I